LKSNTLMKDLTRDAFEAQELPLGVSSCYLGRFYRQSSLGRYLLTASAPEFPIEIKKVSVEFVTAEERGIEVPDFALSNILGYQVHLDMNFKEDIAAFLISYEFYDIWGQQSAFYSHQIVSDHEKGKQNLSEPITLDMVSGVEDLFENIIPGLKPMAFYMGIISITACRTTDGALFITPQEYLQGVQSWALGNG